ncbi:hypothetical protein Bca101_068594 [Brassica carinata]
MANSYTLLVDLRAGRCSNTAEVRLLRLWEARNINKRGELMSVEMLLIDESDTLVQGCLPAGFQSQFRERLIEGSVYTLSGFDVTRSNPKFRLTDGPVSIRFNECTAVEKLASTARTIPTEHVRFRTHKQILELANSGRQLPDVIGELRAIRSTITDRIPGAQRVMLTLRVDGDVNVCVSLFDSLALAFHTKLDGYGREPKIVIVTGINPKVVLGKLYLNGTSASRIFFDSDTLVGKDRLDRQCGGRDEAESSSKVVHAQKIEPLTIDELNQFVLSAEPQIIEFLCTAKVTEILLGDGWYRVVLSVSDPTGTASFVGFDKEVAKLTQVLASEAAHIVGIGVNARVDTCLPRALADIVGNSYIFQLKLTDFNFTANHQTFTISRIFTTPQMAPNPNFAVQADVDVPIPPVLRNVTPASKATGSIGNNVAGEASASDGPPAGRAAAEEDQNAPEEGASKKARVE